MKYIESSLSKGEKIESIFKLHWLTWVIPSVITFLGITIFLPSLFGNPSLENMTLYISLGLIIYGTYKLLSLACIEQGVTNKRAIKKTGIISRNTEENRLGKIETVEINQGILGRIFGFGNVKITGTGNAILLFASIDNPLEVKNQIESNMEIQQ